jgi:chemotaxis protein MotB
MVKSLKLFLKILNKAKQARNMSDDSQQIIIIKKINKGKKEQHGGSWKIAYADFVTAMMAFFMLLWLLSLLNKYQLQGIAAYFQKPLTDIFVGSKNAEQYKNQTNAKTIKIEQDIGGSANSNIKDKKSTQPAVKSEQTQPADVKPTQSESKSESQVKSEAMQKQVADKAMGAAKQKIDQNEQDKESKKIKRKLEISLQNNTKVSGFKENLNFEVTHDGVKVSLHDSSKNEMFSLGRPDFKNYARQIISWLSNEFNDIPKKIIIIGHTDAYQYDPNAKYSNWELSTDRANAVRYLLIEDGMNASKIIRVEGAADVSLLDRKNGDNPLNRRVEIIVLTDEAAQRIMDQ